jgi:predicted  nucleic acid-binding Zn-ribbon protein
MKGYLSTILALACAILVISLIAMKHGDNAQHETDTGSITDFSNRLDSAKLDVLTANGTIMIYSNNLAASQSAATAFSNQLTAAQSALALDAEQITSLNRQVAAAESDNQTLGRRLVDLNGKMTNQVAVLTEKLALTETNLAQANEDYSLLENRFRRNVAERLVLERKYRNPVELQEQLDRLKYSPSDEITADKIYAGLDVEVISNRFHVITPN